MSCLLLKTSGNLQKEVVKATPEEFFCEKTYGGSSCWPASDQPSRVVHADCSEGSSWEESAVGFEDLQRGIWSSEEEEEDLQSGIFTSKGNYLKESKAIGNSSVCQREQQQAWQEYVVDELVCKLISQLHFPPEPPAFCSEKGELHELDYQEGDTGVGKTSACSLDAEISKISTPVCAEDSKEPLPISLAEPEVSSGGRHREPAVELRSALRGGYVKSGLGHRPRMHVTWAPDVYDPPCTSTSHTSNQNRRKHHHHHHHHHSKGEHKNRHKGKGSSHSDSQKKSQKKLLRRLKHAGETFSSGSIVFPQREQQSGAVRYITPALDDLTSKSLRVGPLISLQKASFPSPVLSLGECEFVTLDKIQGCHPRHVVPTHKLFV